LVSQYAAVYVSLETRDVGRTRALWGLLDVKFEFLSLFEVRAANVLHVEENVFVRVLSFDKAVTASVVEEIDRTFRHSVLIEASTTYKDCVSGRGARSCADGKGLDAGGRITGMQTTRQTAAEVVVVDYGLGNLRSVTRGLQRAGATVDLIEDPGAVSTADGIVLPGVGAFSEGMDNAGPFREALIEAADAGTPLFGICLGMQMLLTTSEEADHAGEGDAEGLDLIPGQNRRFRGDQKVPHMGWNELSVERDHPIVEGVDGQYAYFVHSYYTDPDDEGTVVTTTDYGTTFASVVADQSGTVFGTQFHPEKSGDTGLRILQNFVEYAELRAR